MKYLEARNDSDELKRASLANAVPWARSVVLCAVNYNADAALLHPRRFTVAGMDLSLRLVQTRLPRCGTRKTTHAGSQADATFARSRASPRRAPGVTSIPAR